MRRSNIAATKTVGFCMNPDAPGSNTIVTERDPSHDQQRWDYQQWHCDTTLAWTEAGITNA
jgi:hypothetical protein